MKKPKKKEDKRKANKGGHEVAYEPTPEEILETGKSMREEGWQDRNGRWHPPIGLRWEKDET